MARSERRILGFTVAILILALAVGLLGWADRNGQSDRRRLQDEATANRARVDQLEHQLRDHGIEPAAPTTTSTTVAVRRSQPRVTSTTAVHAPATTRPVVETTTTRPSSPPSTPPPTGPPPSTTSTTACAVQLIGRCVP